MQKEKEHGNNLEGKKELSKEEEASREKTKHRAKYVQQPQEKLYIPCTIYMNWSIDRMPK